MNARTLYAIRRLVVIRPWHKIAWALLVAWYHEILARAADNDAKFGSAELRGLPARIRGARVMASVHRASAIAASTRASTLAREV